MDVPVVLGLGAVATAQGLVLFLIFRGGKTGSVNAGQCGGAWPPFSLLQPRAHLDPGCGSRSGQSFLRLNWRSGQAVGLMWMQKLGFC